MNLMDPYSGVFKLLAPRPKVCRVEEEGTILILKPSIPYENRGPVTFWVKGTVIVAIVGIEPLVKIEVVKTIVAQIDDSWLGGGTPPVVTTLEGI